MTSCDMHSLEIGVLETFFRESKLELCGFQSVVGQVMVVGCEEEL